MNIQFTFKQMASSQALSELVHSKLATKIERFTAQPVHAHVTFSVEGLNQRIHVSLITADGHDIEADHSGEDMYSEIDLVLEKVEAQLRKHKERLKAHKGESIRGNLAAIAAANGTTGESLDSLSDDAIDAKEILNFESNKNRDLQPVAIL